MTFSDAEPKRIDELRKQYERLQEHKSYLSHQWRIGNIDFQKFLSLENQIKAESTKILVEMQKELNTLPPTYTLTGGIGAQRQHMSGIPNHIGYRLRQVLLGCCPQNRETLRAIFYDDRISPWRDQLPEAHSDADRVDRVIALLYTKSNAAQENALVLFLRVLRDRHDPNDNCYRQLNELSNELENVTRPISGSNVDGWTMFCGCVFWLIILAVCGFIISYGLSGL